ncbi:hypothetical protein FRC14_007568 [Serendipita sp. 396]|nr:hypothetical protein FRC14_007568 [Serendipita sp. 396]
MDGDNSLDYSQGKVRHHHKFYLATGDVLFQVEKALFKIHRHFLAQYSPVLEGLFEPPSEQNTPFVREEQPISIQGDSYRGWEALLALFYRENHVEAQMIPWDDAIALIPIAHKYCMQALEISTLKRIKTEMRRPEASKEKFVDVIRISKLLDLFSLFFEAASRLADRADKLSYEDAQKIGLFAFYVITGFSSRVCQACRELNIPRVCSGCKKLNRPIGLYNIEIPADWRI